MTEVSTQDEKDERDRQICAAAQVLYRMTDTEAWEHQGMLSLLFERFRELPAVKSTMERKGELHEFFDNVQKRLGAVEEFLRGDQSDVIVTMKPTGDPRISCLRRTQNQPIEASFLYILGIRRLALAYQEGFGSEALPDAGSRSTGQVRSFSENHSFPVDLARAALKPGRKTLFIENYLGQPGITLVFMLSTRALERMLPHQVEKVCLLLSFGEYPKISQLASDLSHDLISYQQIFNRRVGMSPGKGTTSIS